MPSTLARSRVADSTALGRGVAVVRHGLLAAAVAAGTWSVAACGGWRGAGDTYYPHRVPAKRARLETGYRFGMPGGQWRPLRKVEGMQVGWMHPEIRGVIEVRAQCDEQGDSDLYQYTDHLGIDWTEWTVLEQSDERLIGRAALRSVVTGRLDGVQMQLELWVVKRAGCLFDLRYAAAPDSFSQGQADFSQVVGGFSYPL
ncbi:MAG: hypothetical protein AAF721_31575 [Myxococcota bacterium]